MVTATQADHVLSLVRERHGGVRQSFDGLLEALARGDQSHVLAANADLTAKLSALKAVVAADHWPQWLRELEAACLNYANNHRNGMATWKHHLQAVIRFHDDLNGETWDFSAAQEAAFDPDEIIDQARMEFRIDELYGKVIATLRSLADCDEIDSVKACSDLRAIIASMERAREGTFTSQVFTWQFARRLVPNIISAYVKRSNLTGPVLEAFEQTATELDVSLQSAKDQIGERILREASAGLKTDCARNIAGSELFLLASPAGTSVASGSD